MSDDKELVGAFLGLIIAVVLFFFCVFWLTTAIREELEPIKQNGIKPVIEWIWCGENGCEEES